MRNAKHRRRTWAERHEETAILMVVMMTGVLMGICLIGNFIC